jgi:hypothetical protein
MASIKGRIDIKGLAAVKRAFIELEPKLARKVIRQAERKALEPIKQSVQASAPVHSGKLKKSIRIRSAKGPRKSGRKTIATALLIGASGRKGDKEKGIVRPWWAFLIEFGWKVGKRIRRGGKTVGREGSGRKIQGKHLVRTAMRSHESASLEIMRSEILAGIEREAKS